MAEPLKLSAEEAASAVLTLAGEQMIKAIQEITVQDGVNPGESIIVAGGGAAGLNIIPIAQALGCRRVLLPRTAGALSACGGQFSNIVTEFSASRYAHSNTFDFEGVSVTLSGIAARMDAFEEKLRGRSIDPLRPRILRRGSLHQPAVGDGDPHAHGPLRHGERTWSGWWRPSTMSISAAMR